MVGPTLVAALRGLGLRGGDDEQRPGVIHRLDRDTSGLLVLSRSDEAYASLGEQMRARRIEREYVALVRGRPPSRRGTIDAPIGRDRNDVGRMAVGGRGERAGRDAFRAGRAAGGREPAASASSRRAARTRSASTWRRSAIRCSAIRSTACRARRSACGRQFLHAARLAFAHPADGHRVELTSELPPDLAEALERARAAG